LKRWLKFAWFRVLGKDPEAVVVCFLSGPQPLGEKMAEEIRVLLPERRHFTVPFEGGSTLATWLRLRRRFRMYRIGLAPVLFNPEKQYAPLRRAAFLLAPRRVLAYNARMERHHLRLRTGIASLLFLRGVPLDRINLRPTFLFPWKKDRTVIPANVQEWEGRAPVPGRNKVAIVTPYFPWPLAHGGAVRIYSLLMEIAREFDIILLSFGESDAQGNAQQVLEVCTRVVVVDKPRYREPRWVTLLPPEVCEYRSPAMAEALRKIRIGCGVVQVEYTALAPYGGSVLVEHDVTFDLYKQIWKRERTLSAWWDYWRWQRFERSVIRTFRRVVVMSEKDRELVGAAQAVVIPNGVDLDRFQPTPEPDNTQRLLFVGSFRHFPNVVAFRFFFEEVWPSLRRRFPGIEATAVAGPDPHLHWPDLPRIEGVRLLEFVSDVKPLYEQTNVAIAPTLVSAGTNVKVLEALAMERAVVSTTSGCAGLGLEHGITAWVADGPKAFEDGVAALLEDPGLRRDIARAGRAHAERHFDWKAIGEAQRGLFRELLGTGSGIRPARAPDLPALREIQGTSPEAAQWQPRDYLTFDCHVAMRAGRLAGFVVSRPIVAGEREILNVAVHADFRRQGVAKELIEAELRRWPGDHFLEVRESNHAARRLYSRLGFRDVGLRPGYYDHPSEPGIVMKLFS
jgi:ribosomal protein S18 acetylase RimI-like enzyme